MFVRSHRGLVITRQLGLPSEGQHYRKHCCLGVRIFLMIQITMPEGSQTDWVGDQFMTLPLWVLCGIQLREMLLLFSVSWPPTLPNLCPINLAGTDIFCGNQIWITILSFIPFELLKLLFPLRLGTKTSPLFSAVLVLSILYRKC